MPKAKLMLIACDDEADISRVNAIVQHLTDNGICAAGMEVRVDWRELEMPVAQVIPQLIEPMVVGLRQRYPFSR